MLEVMLWIALTLCAVSLIAIAVGLVLALHGRTEPREEERIDYPVRVDVAREDADRTVRHDAVPGLTASERLRRDDAYSRKLAEGLRERRMRKGVSPKPPAPKHHQRTLAGLADDETRRAVAQMIREEGTSPEVIARAMRAVAHDYDTSRSPAIPGQGVALSDTPGRILAAQIRRNHSQEG